MINFFLSPSGLGLTFLEEGRERDESEGGRIEVGEPGDNSDIILSGVLG